MALFGRKKQDESSSKDASAVAGGNGSSSGGGAGGTGAPGASGAGGYEFSPDKAQKFFERAATLHEATNFEFAMIMWLGGLRQDPTSIRGLEGFFRSAGAFMNSGAKGPSKDTLKQFSEGKPIERYLNALLQWSAHPTEAAYGVRAMEMAADLGLPETSVWIAERAFGAADRDKRPRKDYYLKIMEVLHKFQKFDLAVRAGEAALRVDPTDARLAAELRNMSAESTMTRSGFDQTGQAGGFRANIRDSDAQRRLEEEQRLVKTDDTHARLIAQAKGDWDANRLDKPNIRRYVKLLMDRGNPEDETTAIAVLEEAARDTHEFSFRENAETIRLRQLRRGVMKARDEAEAGEAGARERLGTLAREFAERRLALAQAQVAAYPTDLYKKYELGKLFLEADRYEDAIAQFQEAKADLKNRARVLHQLGLSFSKIGYADEAVETLRQALSMHATPDDATGLELRYALMESLASRAGEQGVLADAEEAYKIAASISVQQINYKDIRTHRENIKQLVGKLKGGAATSGGGVA